MCNATALAGPMIEVLQFDSEHSALDALHAIVVADFLVIIAFTRAMFAQRPGAGSQISIVRNERATFTVGAEILARIKTETRQHTEGADDLAFVLCSMCLGGIFDQWQVMLPADLEERIDVERVSVQMDWHDRFGARRDRLFDESRAEVEGGVIDVDVNRLRTDV